MLVNVYRIEIKASTSFSRGRYFKYVNRKWWYSYTNLLLWSHYDLSFIWVLCI